MILFLIFAIIAAGVAPMIAEIRRGEFTFFNPKNFFIGYYIIVLGMSGLVMVVTGPSQVFSRDYAATPEVYVQALWTALAGLVAFQCGYYAQYRAYVPMPRLLLADWPKQRVVFVVLTCYAIGLVGFLAIVREAGGLSGFVASLSAWRSGGQKGHGIQTIAATTLMASASHILFIRFVTPDTKRRTIALIFLAYCVSSIPAFVLGFRASVALPFMQLVVLWHFRRKKVSGIGLAASVSALALGFTLYGVYRELPKALDTRQLATMAAANPDLLFNVVARTRGVEVLAEVQHRLRETKAFDLSSASPFEALTIMIPAKLWPGKPLSTGERFTTYFYGEDFVYSRGTKDATFGGVSPTIAAEFYWHLGMTGVVVGLFLFGLAVRIVYRTIRIYQYANGALLLYATFYTNIGLMAEFFQIYVNGTVLTTIMLTGVLVALTARMSFEGAAPALVSDWS